MSSRFSTLLPWLGSAALHAVLVAMVGSASGTEAAEEELRPARFQGNTFEIEALLEAPPPRQAPAPALEAAEPSLPEGEAAVPREQPLRLPKAAPVVPEPEPLQPERASAVSESPPASPAPTAPVPRAPAPLAAKPPEQARPSQPPAGAPPAGKAPSTKSPSHLPAPATTAAPAAAPESSASPAGSGSEWGQAALPANVASLSRAFTRAVPRAAFRDAAWHRLPFGSAGSVLFSLELDAAGKLVPAPVNIETRPAPPRYLAELVQRTVLMLKAGTFALGPSSVQAGTQRFELSAELRQTEALDDTLAEPHDLRQIGRLVEPSRVRPGKANFTYNSGRQVELTIRLLAN